MNNRRRFLVAFGAGVLATPLSSFAQMPGKVWRVGFLYFASRQSALDTGQYNAFLEGMRELGYVEEKHFVIEARFADGKFERLPGLAAELTKLKMDIIVTSGTPATSAAQKATKTIPIIFGSAGDPVGSGFVKNLAYPGGNITGLSDLAGELALKDLDMLLSMVPKLSRVAVLVNPDNSFHAGIQKNVQVAALRASVRVLPAKARSPQDIENAFTIMARENAGAVIVMPDALFAQQRRQIVELAAKNRLPFIASSREYVEAGGLMSYGPDRAEQYRRAATYVDKILKGARPADLPVEQPTKFELFINGKTAKALGLTMPQSLLIMADKVIE